MYLHKILKVLQRICIFGRRYDWKIIEIESRYVIFLEEHFPKRGEIISNYMKWKISKQVRSQDRLI